MSINEIAAIVACLLAGYWLASKFMDVKEDERNREEKYRKGNFSESGKERGQEKQSSHSSQETAHNQSSDLFECSKEYLRSNWFVILDVRSTASNEEISAAYKVKIRQYHPDKCVGLGKELKELAEKKAKQINAAYQYANDLRQ